MKEKIAFIICSNNETYLQECLNYLSFLEVPEGMETEVIRVGDAKSMAEGYQSAMRESNAKYKVYLHQDVFILNRQFIRDVRRIFTEHPEYGLLGVIGSSRQIENAVYWDKWDTGMADTCDSWRSVHLCMETTADVTETVAVDGMLMITQYDVDWRTDLEIGFDFYDISQSEEFKKAGYRIGVPHQESAWCYHDCGYSKLGQYDRAREIFCTAYGNEGYCFSPDDELRTRRLRGMETEKLLPLIENTLKQGEIAKAEAMIAKTQAFFPYHTGLCMDGIFCEILRKEAGKEKRGFWIDDWKDGFTEKYTAYKFLLRRLEYGKPTEDLSDVLEWILGFEGETLDIGKIVVKHAINRVADVCGELRKLLFENEGEDEGEDGDGDDTDSAPLVSVVLPGYNHAEYVGEAIESVLNQTYTNFELIIADDASTDGSAEVIKRYRDSRIRFIPIERNTGFRAAETAFASASGKYIVGFASDDRLLPELLETHVRFMEKNKQYGACFCRPTIIDGSGRKTNDTQMEMIFEAKNRTKEEWFYRLYCGGNCMLAPGFCIRRELFREFGVFRYEYRQLQDYEYWLRLLQKTEIYVHTGSLVQYRIHWNEEIPNISMPTEEVLHRDYMERLYILLESMEDLSENFFLKTFWQELIWLPGTEGYCLECEKFCVMQRAAAVPQEAAAFFYFRHCGEEKFRHYLETYYGVFRKDIWKLSGAAGRIAPKQQASNDE